jgi:hypothetical protein
MKVIGMSEEAVIAEIKKIDFEKAVAESPKTQKKERVKQKFKAVGFDDEMLEFIGVEI